MLLTLDNRFDFSGQPVAWGCIGEGDPVVLIHGFPWSAQSWRNIAPWLAKNNTVYYYDMIGCGESGKHEGQAVSAAVQSDLLADLMTHWQLDCPHVIAHDFGGLASLRGYFINQLRYRKLTLIDAVAVLPSGSPFFRHVHDHEQAFAGLPDYAHEALFMAYIQNAAYHTLSDQVCGMYALPWKGRGQAAFYRQIAQSDIAHIEQAQALYGPMQNPVDIIWGCQDTFIPINQGKELATIIGADQFTPIQNAGHIVQEDAPEAVVGCLLTS